MPLIHHDIMHPGITPAQRWNAALPQTRCIFGALSTAAAGKHAYPAPVRHRNNKKYRTVGGPEKREAGAGWDRSPEENGGWEVHRKKTLSGQDLHVRLEDVQGAQHKELK